MILWGADKKIKSKFESTQIHAGTYLRNSVTVKPGLGDELGNIIALYLEHTFSCPRVDKSVKKKKRNDVMMMLKVRYGEEGGRWGQYLIYHPAMGSCVVFYLEPKKCCVSRTKPFLGRPRDFPNQINYAQRAHVVQKGVPEI